MSKRSKQEQLLTISRFADRVMVNCQIVHEQEQKRAIERAIAHEQKEQEQTPKIDLKQRKFPLPQTGTSQMAKARDDIPS